MREIRYLPLIIALLLVSFTTFAQDISIEELFIDAQAIKIETSPNGQYFVTYAEFQFFPDEPMTADLLAVRLYDTTTGDLVLELTSVTDFTIDIAFTDDSAQMATHHQNGIINMWDVESGDLIKTLYGTSNGFSPIHFLNDGASLISRTGDLISHYLLWDVENSTIQAIMTHRFDSMREMREELDGFRIEQTSRRGSVTSVISSNSHYMYTASQTGAIWQWNLVSPHVSPKLLMEGGQFPQFPIRSLYLTSDEQSLLFYFESREDVMPAGLYQLDINTSETKLLTDAYVMHELALSVEGETIVWGDGESSQIFISSLSNLEQVEMIDLAIEDYDTQAWRRLANSYVHFLGASNRLIVGGFSTDDFMMDVIYIVDLPE